MNEPTGLEPTTPVKIKATSATERAAFRKCRRQWFLSVVHRLQSSDGRNLHFWFGELIHTSLETYYLGQLAGLPHALRVEPALEAYEEAYEASLEPMREELGFLWPTVEGEYHEMGLLGMAMLQGYFEREERDPLFDEVVQVEQRLMVPIKAPGGRKVGTLAVKADAVGRRGGRLTVADHKTAGQRMPSAQLDIDDQLTAEAFAVWIALGEFPEEVQYNALAKKAPHPPKVLKSGKLSQDKGQLTTFDLYLAEIRRLGLPVSDYSEILATLREAEDRGESSFFWREGTFRTPSQMTQFQANLYEEFKDQRAVALHPERAYPAPGPFSCPSCPVRLICTTMMDGGDTAAVIRAEYVVGDPRY